MSLSNKKIWISYFLSKVLYMFFAVFIYGSFTQLGDTYRYLKGPGFFVDYWFINSTHLIDTVAHLLYIIGGEFLAHLFFLSLSFYGVYYSVKRLPNLVPGKLILILLLLSLPSFGVWTSIVSKESVSVFFMGVMLGALIDYFEKKKTVNITLILLAIYLGLLIKPQYFIALFFVFVFVYLSRKFSLSSLGNFFLIVINFVVFVILLYVFRNEINSLSFMMVSHFSIESEGTRVNEIWINDYDFFRNLFYGMYISFVGPTYNEALARIPLLLTLIESYFILIIGLLSVLYVALFKFHSNHYYYVIFWVVLFYLLFVHYPFGALNPGSAIRYRQSFYSFVVILYFYSIYRLNRR